MRNHRFRAAKVKQRTAVKWTSKAERDEARGTRRQSAQRLGVVLLQMLERGLERLLLVDLLQGLE